MALLQLLATIDNNHSPAFGNDKYVKQKKKEWKRASMSVTGEALTRTWEWNTVENQSQ